FIEEHTEDFRFYEDFIKSFRMVPTTEKIGVDLVDIATLAELMMDMKTVILVGNGVQKYAHGTEVIWAIDSLAAMLGLFGKEGCGVSFLGDTSLGLDDPFKVEAKRVIKPEVDFGAYDLCFIQASNPAVTMPDSKKVIEGLKKSFCVVFGLYDDETAQLADLVIPAKNFLQKSDIRFSYGHEFVELMPKLQENDKALSEYELTKEMFKRFGLGDLEAEETYIEHFTKQLKKRGDYFVLPSFEEVPYKDGFEEPFCFIDEVEDEFDYVSEGYYLITPKPKNAINSQFKRDPFLYLPLRSGFKDEDRVIVSSKWGEVEMEVRLLAELRDDCVLAYSGSAINYVTPPKADNYGNNAVFQELKVQIRKA
ncbi:MAG: molybdopterin oxidoreductase, partial [Epsilonproteobacteria bacterium]|nr:molybdopterin oxidoreductase [Campylobacterota bacterium]NPA64045.1 molybdopterin-dependent oxidoreductase [Campylobacterota bacterium]